MPSALQVTAVAWLFVSLGHTVSRKDWQNTAKFNSLPQLATTCAKAGWLQGSGFFIMNALINYWWSKNPEALTDPIQKAIAGVMVAIMGASSLWYAKNGVTSNAVAVTAIGALQSYAAFL
ncbi:hypothetical protein VHEMI00900 [[Torrubiella] hemipterigena]|uniref:Integral membrane protein n=1 Tax=[Torrubiella] hemipterigena TaxID=1531966 RepID=A0A0A1SRQ2_9HYPO|nr:hypothetical protein VHEMI00900 [[Torrubiella] hemipterigena]